MQIEKEGPVQRFSPFGVTELTSQARHEGTHGTISSCGSEYYGSFRQLLGRWLPLVAEASISSVAWIPKLAPGAQVAARAPHACG